MDFASPTRRKITSALASFVCIGGLSSREVVAEEHSETDVAYVIFELGIDFDTMRALHETILSVMKKGIQEVVILIDSFGGNVSAAIATYHFLLALPVKITTYNMSDVDSAAILIYLAGEKRVANVSSRFAFHSVSTNVHRDGISAVQLSRLADDALTVNERMKAIYKLRMRVDEDYAKKLLQTDLTFVSSAEAKDIGLVTVIDELHINSKSTVLSVTQRPPGSGPTPPVPAAAPR